MAKAIPEDNFGSYLRMLRKRARITQRDLGIETGYSEGQICRFEQGHKPPDLSTLVALFVPALDVKNAPNDVARLLELAALARDEALSDKQVSSQPNIPVKVKSLSAAPAIQPSPMLGKMSKRERDAHLAAARWALNAEGDVIAAAQHYLSAGALNDAIDVLYDRGVALFNQGRWQDAADVIDKILAHIERALSSSAETDAMRCRLYEVRGDLLLHTVQAEEAQHNFETALALVDGAVHAKLAHKLCVCLAQRGKPTEALALAQSILHNIDPKHILLIAQLRIAQANAFMSLGQLEQAEHSNLEALQLADKMILFAPVLAMSIRARAHNVLGAIHAMQKHTAIALEHWKQAQRYAADSGLAQIQHRSEGNIANLLYEQGDIAGALAASQRAILGLQTIGDSYGVARFVHLQSILHYIQANYAECVRVAQTSETLKNTLGDVAGVIGSQNQQAKALLMLGRIRESNELLVQVLEKAEVLKDARLLAFTYLLACDVALAKEDGDEALRAVEQAVLQLNAVQNDVTLAQDIHLHRVLTYLALNQSAQAQKLLAEHILPANASLEIRLETAIVNALCQDSSAQISPLNLAQTHGYQHYFEVFQRFEQVLMGHFKPVSILRYVLFGLQ